MTVLSIVLALVALVVAGLALRRVDVVERRARTWLVEAPTTGGKAAAPAPAPVTGTPTNALSRVAVVRYDAFEDVGGRLSFSAAMVDDSGRGLVLTAIHGRGETRSYIKQVPVTAASGQRELSPEETQAVTEALRA